MKLEGCGTAIVTPFTADDTVDEASLRVLVEWQINSGIRLLVACGTTGETPTLDEQEWLRIIEIVVESAAGRVPVFAGCTHNSTREAVAKAKRACAVRGLTGLLSANPYYNKPTQEGQFQHFRAIADASRLPMLLYNIPGRSAANLQAATIARLAEIKNIVGVKESSGNLQQITETVTMVSPDFNVLAGDDNLALAILGVGGVGLVSVASNVIPEQMSAMVNAALDGDWDVAQQVNRKYYRLMLDLFCEPNPIPVKCLLAMMGLVRESYRLPMTPPTQATRQRMEELAEEFGLGRHTHAA